MANLNREELRNEVYARLAENAGFYSDDEINRWLWEGVRDVSTRLEPLKTTATSTTITDTAEYDLPNNYISILKVFYKDTSDKWSELIEMEFESLWEQHPNWETDTPSLPHSFYWRTSVLGLYPIPSATYAGANKLRIIYTYIPFDLNTPSDDSATTGLPEWMDTSIIAYATWRCRLKDRDDEKAERARGEYENDISIAATILNKSRKNTIPKLQPNQRAYREYYHGPNWDDRIRVTS